MKVFKKFLIAEIVFTILIGIIAFVLFNSIFKDYYLSIFWVLLGVIALLTGMLHYSVLVAARQDVSKFASKFIMVTGLKMIIYLIFITAYVFTNPEKAKSFLLSFLAIYILYTVFEVVLALRVIKAPK